MLGFRFEERQSGIISVYDIQCKQNEKDFEEMVDVYKKASTEELILLGRNALDDLYGDFKILWEDAEERLEALFAFTQHAINLGCYEMSIIPEAKKEVISEFYAPFGEKMSQIILLSDRYFHPDQYSEDDNKEMIEIFLCASLKPLESPYPFKLYSFMLACAAAGQFNESGVNKIRELRKNYMKYVRERNT